MCIHCALFTCVIHCALFTVLYSLCFIHMRFSLCFIHCALFTVLYSLYRLKSRNRQGQLSHNVLSVAANALLHTRQARQCKMRRQLSKLRQRSKNKQQFNKQIGLRRSRWCPNTFRMEVQAVGWLLKKPRLQDPLAD